MPKTKIKDHNFGDFDYIKACNLMHRGLKIRCTEWLPYQWVRYNCVAGCVIGWNGVNWTDRFLGMAGDDRTWVVWDETTEEEYMEEIERAQQENKICGNRQTL